MIFFHIFSLINADKRFSPIVKKGKRLFSVHMVPTVCINELNVFWDVFRAPMINFKLIRVGVTRPNFRFKSFNLQKPEHGLSSFDRRKLLMIGCRCTTQGAFSIPQAQ
ncbi:hypothetical protein A3728_18670 [Sulfitobacter sp. HI0040]|nr:hypothetical protein A3728_18670 [Sulfitobacter sp. HI0040]